MMTDDPFDLARFVDAQAPVYERVLQELRAGMKRSHWMWFVFPQVAGLGSSPMARRYAIVTIAEARAYLAHPVLGPRLREVTIAVLATRNRSLGDIFGTPDDLKFCSSMTLFARAGGAEEPFGEALRRICGGASDEATLRRLG